jgi:drug/metabolite transporter (DMT)-like permease
VRCGEANLWRDITYCHNNFGSKSEVANHLLINPVQSLVFTHECVTSRTSQKRLTYFCQKAVETQMRLLHCRQGGRMTERNLMEAGETRPARGWMTLLAFAIIYLVWGSTFLAIRVGVHEVPPFLFAAMRFLVAGTALCGWMMARGERLPSGRQWRSASVLAVLIFVLDYGLLFWAEQRVPSGTAAVMMATIPAFMGLSEIVLLRTQRLTMRLGMGLLVGIGGVVVLMMPHSSEGSPVSSVDRAGAIAILIGAVSWSVASALSRKLQLPVSKGMSSGAQMLAGGVFLTIASAVLGEFRQFHPANISGETWFALAYLIVAGSIVGFTAYVWLLHHQPAAKVGTYAYVNPVVAVVLGYFLGEEPLGLPTVLGMALVLVSVLVITTTQVKKLRVVADEAA